MKILFKTWQSLAAMLASIANSSVAGASVNSPSNYIASLAQENQRPTFHFVMQFGMPGDQKYVFCHEQDCQRRTPKHIAIAEKSILPPLKMPDPVKLEPTVPPIPTIDQSPDKPVKPHIRRQLRKPLKKKSIKCEPDK